MAKAVRNVWEQIAGRWQQVRGEVRNEWRKLTDDDIDQIKGWRDVLAGKIQQRYSLALEEADLRIDQWIEGRKI
jgi:uncharacterized protein YjbJ (UPF0337 family)